MINKTTFHYCEYCKKASEDISPPTKEQYENAQIHIVEGHILLPQSVVAKNRKPCVSDSHCKFIDGYYCNIECLQKRINKILRRPHDSG